MHTKTHIYEWIQESDSSEISFRTNDHYVEHLIAFKIEEIPDFDSNKEETNQNKYFENLLSQKVFIDTVNSIFLANEKLKKSVFELRILNNPNTRTIDCYVIFRLVAEQSVFIDFSKMRVNIREIMPDEYVYSEVDDNTIKELLKLKERSIVEVRKHTNLIPVGSTAYTSETARIPHYTIPLQTLSSARYYLPTCNYLQPKAYNLASLYKVLQELQEEVQIRISISTCTIFEIEKNIALQFSNFLKATYGNLGSYEVSNYEMAFVKYISNKNLYSTKIQIASLNEKTATHIAHLFCGQMTYGEFATQANLSVVSLRDENKSFVKSDWENCNHYHFSSFKVTYQEGDIDKNIQAFMQRLPYLYDGSEVSAILRLPVSNSGGLPGFIVKPIKPFYQPNPKTDTHQAEIKLGQIISSNTNLNKGNGVKYSLSIPDLTKHGLIVGSTGSGKTNTTLNFVKELTEKGIPFLLIEPVKSEYRYELDAYFKSKNIELNYFNFKNPFLSNGDLNKEFFRFNPLIPIEGISIAQHISYIKGCFSAAFPMHGIMPMILEDCLYELYGIACKIDVDGKGFFDLAKTPKYQYEQKLSSLTVLEQNVYSKLDINSLTKVIEHHLKNEKLYPDSRTRQEFGGYLQRRIQRLTKGVLGFSLSPSKWKSTHHETVNNNIQTLLTKPTIIELETLADNEEKALIMAFILTMIFEYRQVLPSTKSLKTEQGEKFDLTKNIHITIIEEAHRLLSSSSMNGSGGGEIVTQDSKSKSISLFIDMLAEIRAKGEGIFIVEQIPTKLVSDVIKNTNLKIMHRITSKDDRHYLGEAMNMTERQKNYVTNLKTGESIIFEEQLDNPVFVKINEFEANGKDT